MVNGFKHNLELVIVFFLELRKLTGQFFVTGQHPAQSPKGPLDNIATPYSVKTYGETFS